MKDRRGEGGWRIWVRTGGVGLRVLSAPGEWGLRAGVDTMAIAKGKRCGRTEGWGRQLSQKPQQSGPGEGGKLIFDRHQLKEDEESPELSSLLYLDVKWDEGFWKTGGQSSSPHRAV